MIRFTELRRPSAAHGRRANASGLCDVDDLVSAAHRGTVWTPGATELSNDELDRLSVTARGLEIASGGPDRGRFLMERGEGASQTR